MSDSQPAPSPDAPAFQIEKIYVKDLSLEVPGAPDVFLQADNPALEIQVRNEAAQIQEGLFEVTVTVTVTARGSEKTLFLVEVAQSGLFSARNIPAQDMEPLLAVGCPTILYPYVREAVSDLVTRAGFPSVVLAPVSFEQMYLQRRQQQAQDDGPRIEIGQ